MKLKPPQLAPGLIYQDSLLTGVSGPAGNFISIEADTEAVSPGGTAPFMYRPGIDYPITNADGTNFRYATVKVRVLDPNFSLVDDGQDTTDTRRYWSNSVSGSEFSNLAIETFTDEEQNYESGTLIQITGVIGPVGGLDADQINGQRSVVSAVSLENSQSGYAYLIVQFEDEIETGTGGITGASWGPLPL